MRGEMGKKTPKEEMGSPPFLILWRQMDDFWDTLSSYKIDRVYNGYNPKICWTTVIPILNTISEIVQTNEDLIKVPYVKRMRKQGWQHP